MPILDWFGIGDVQIQFVDLLPHVPPDGPLDLGTAIDPGDSPFPLLRPGLLGEPDGIYRAGDVVTLLYGTPEQVRALVTEIANSGFTPSVGKKLAEAGTRVEFVPIRGSVGPALWITGKEHLVLLPGGPARLAANTLIWTRGPLTIRLRAPRPYNRHARSPRAFTDTAPRLKLRPSEPGPPPRCKEGVNAATQEVSHMKRLVSVVAAAAVLAALVATSALAKGASEAIITGPGLGDGISLAGEEEAEGGALMQITEDAGFFPSVFATTPNPMLSKRPAGELGPRYTIRYTMPGPNGVTNRLVQDLYPYAHPTPVTHMAPGQRYFGAQRAVGGWFVAATTLKDGLVTSGLPESAPPADGSGIPTTSIEVAAAAIVALLAALGAVIVARRRWPGGRHATT